METVVLAAADLGYTNREDGANSTASSTHLLINALKLLGETLRVFDEIKTELAAMKVLLYRSDAVNPTKIAERRNRLELLTRHLSNFSAQKNTRPPHMHPRTTLHLRRTE
eukprot:TRINITY_DN5663_c0_g1_i2.p1 TRINITY_DN5663_c0_g1~~TRINITY_DN5663_c0_g1_i2.p1  ORF type:complete len:110 (-),score=16.20 TRINITY_DN5663_c0_g1_i2:366-695(-)